MKYDSSNALLLLPILLGLCLAPKAPAQTTLIDGGTPKVTIYVSKTTAPGHIDGALDQARKELLAHLGKLTESDLRVVETDDASEVEAPAIVLGTLAREMGAIPPDASVSQEGFRIISKDRLVLIGGETDDGVLFGTYELLRRCGFDWVMPGPIGEIVPDKKTCEIPSFDESMMPGFTIRNQYYGGGMAAASESERALFNEWARRHGRGDYTHPAMQTFGHASSHLIRKHKEVFDKDPTMYALQRLPDGTFVRKGPQVEPAHPKVAELMAQDIRDEFASKNWPHDKEVGFPVGPADGSAFSVSPESRALNSGLVDLISGREDVTDSIVYLANQVLQKIEGEYPNVWVGYYVYAQYSGFPLREKPHPKIVPIFATINLSRIYSSQDPRSRTRGHFVDTVAQWSALAKKQGNIMVSRDFNYNLADNISPISKVQVWGEEIPFYHEMGLFGVNINSYKAWALYGPQNYVLQRLLWSPHLDWKEVLAEYCRNSFGKGAPSMEKYFRRLVETQGNAGHEAGSYHVLSLIFDDAFIQKSEADIATALQTATTAEDKTRIEYIAGGLTSLKKYLAYYQATLQFDFPKAQIAYQAMLDHQDALMQSNPLLATVVAKQYLERFLKSFVNEAVLYSGGEYRIAERLADELPTILDPHLAGEKMGYYRPQINDQHWIKTKTYSSTWDAQGLGNFRAGASYAVWYRTKFATPEILEGQAPGLFLGGFDDEARVWVNGKFIGSSGRRFSNPAVFDLSGSLKPDGENHLAIEVLRNTAMNELGTGGLIRPSFLFVGPKLPRQAPVLPEELPSIRRADYIKSLTEGEQEY